MSNKDWWTPERRQAQRDRINATRPWEHSTGPRTPEGKAICSQNAAKPFSIAKRLKHLQADMKAALKEQREALRRIG